VDHVGKFFSTRIRVVLRTRLKRGYYLSLVMRDLVSHSSSVSSTVSSTVSSVFVTIVGYLVRNWNRDVLRFFVDDGLDLLEDRDRQWKREGNGINFLVSCDHVIVHESLHDFPLETLVIHEVLKLFKDMACLSLWNDRHQKDDGTDAGEDHQTSLHF